MIKNHTYTYTQLETMTPADTSKKATEYVYDVRDRLDEVKKDNTKVQTNRYDFSHRRIVKKTDSHVTYFLYGQSMGLIGKYNRSGKLQQAYGYLPKSSYTTNPQYTLTSKASGIGYDFDFYHNDHLATPQKLTNSTGTVSWAMESNAFGVASINIQTTQNNLSFPGQYADSEIGLNQNYFRDYAPNLGRYVESDPIGLDGGVNFYGYASQNAVVRFDRFGLFDTDLPWPLGPDLPTPPPGACPYVCSVVASAACYSVAVIAGIGTGGAGLGFTMICAGGSVYVCDQICESDDCETE